MPNFLVKVDRYLLLNFPLIWNSRIHFVAWYSLFVWLAMVVFGLLVSNELINNDFLGFYWLLSILCMLAALIIWLFFLFRHNSTKQHGNRVWGREWVNMLSQYLCMLLISSCILVMPAVKLLDSHFKIQKGNDHEKVNILNVNAGFFPQNEYDLQAIYLPMDSMHLNAISYKLSCPSNYYGYDSYHKLDSNYLIYSAVQERFYGIQGKDSIRQGVESYLTVLKSIGLSHPYSVQKITALIDDTLAYQRDLTFEDINTSINNAAHSIIDTDFTVISRFDFLLDRYFYFIWLIVLLPLTLLILTIFRNTSLKFFLITIGICILLVIVNSIVFGVFFNEYLNVGINIIALGVIAVLWTLVLFLLSIRVFYQKRYRIVNAFAVSIFNILVPFLPLIAVSLYILYNHQMYHWYADSNNIQVCPSEYINSSEADSFFTFAVYIGFFLLVVLQQLYFKPLYERLWSLPK
ncbi:MAG: hypothetical protein PSX81_10760 [bacterium]|nr:hypothetical protein [bacterium]